MADPIKPKTGTSADAPPPTSPPPNTPTATAPPVIDNKELESLRSEVARLKDAEKKRGVAVRKLAAAILTPGDDADKGAGRTVKIRDTLVALVNELAPE